MKNIGEFLRELELKRMNIKQENHIIRDRLFNREVSFSLKPFLIQIAVGVVGLIVMFNLEPAVKSFDKNGGNSPIVFFGYLISGICVVIGVFALFDLIKKILKL